MELKKNVRFEFETILSTTRNKNINTKNVTSVKFINISTNLGDTVVINNQITLDPVALFGGGNTNPVELDLQTFLKEGENDITPYSVRFPSGTGSVLVIKKYNA